MRGRIFGRFRGPRRSYPPGAEYALALVMHRAMIEIRTMNHTGKAMWMPLDEPSDDFRDGVRMLADLCDQVGGNLCAMLERPKSPERIQHSLAYTWRVATPAKRQWLRATFADTGYDHRHLFNDQGDHDKHDEALELGRERISQARTAAQTLLTSRGYSAAEWKDDRDFTLEQLPGPEGPRPTLVFHFTRRAESRRWYRRASLTISVDLATGEASLV